MDLNCISPWFKNDQTSMCQKLTKSLEFKVNLKIKLGDLGIFSNWPLMISC